MLTPGTAGVCDMCMCLIRGGMGGEGGQWMRGLGLSFTNHVGSWGVLDVCLDCGGVGGKWVGGLDQGLEGWGSVMSRVSCEWILCVDGRSRYIVFGACRIHAHL